MSHRRRPHKRANKGKSKIKKSRPIKKTDPTKSYSVKRDKIYGTLFGTVSGALVFSIFVSIKGTLGLGIIAGISTYMLIKLQDKLDRPIRLYKRHTLMSFAKSFICIILLMIVILLG